MSSDRDTGTDDYTRHCLHHVTSDLVFISKISVYDKVDIHRKRLMPKGLLTSIYRTLLSAESRQGSFQFFQSVYREAFLLVETLRKTPETHILAKNLLQHINESKNGLLNHKETYSHDTYHVSKIIALMEYIDTTSQSLSD